MDKNTANTLSKEIVKELEALAKRHNLTITPKGGKFNDFSLTMKIEIAEAEGKKEAQTEKVKDVCSMYGLVEARNGIKLVDFNSRAHKMPFIFLKNGKRFKCDVDTIKSYLGA